MSRHLNPIDLATTSEGGRDYVGHLKKLCDTLGVEYATFVSSNPMSKKILGFTNYPEEWKSHYVTNGLQNIDPTLWAASRSVAPVDWSRLKREPDYSKVFEYSRDFGLPSHGLSVPIRGMLGEVGVLCVSSSLSQDAWSKLKREITGNLLQNAVHLLDTVRDSDPLTKALYRPHLSTRETEVLQWVAAGKSQQDIGDILTISARTVEVHLRSAREKLCAISTAQAVGRAISLGFIQPS